MSKYFQIYLIPMNLMSQLMNSRDVALVITESPTLEY